MYKYMLYSIFLTAVWLHSFIQILAHKSYPLPEETFKDEPWAEERPADQPAPRDPLGEFWRSRHCLFLFSGLTESVSSIWMVWAHYFFGWFPRVYEVNSDDSE